MPAVGDEKGGSLDGDGHGVAQKRKAWAEKSPASEGGPGAFVENEEVFTPSVLQDIDRRFLTHT